VRAPLYQVPSAGELSPADRLLESIRPEFRVDVYYPVIGHPILWGPRCAFAGCPGGCVPVKGPRLCSTHWHRYVRQGKPDLERFIADPALHLSDAPVDEAQQREVYSFRVSGLPDQAKAELQYLLQVRHDERRARLWSHDFRNAVKAISAAGITSLLDEVDVLRYVRQKDRGTRAFLRWATAKLHAAYAPVDLLDRDVWSPADFPNVRANRGGYLHFELIVQPWLRQPVRRWIKLRLDTGLSWPAAETNLSALRTFSKFCASHRPSVGGMADIDRQVLLDYVGFVQRMSTQPETRSKAISGVRIFIDDYRLNRWTPTLPPSAGLRWGEAPQVPEMLPRPVDEHVMRQIEAEGNLARLPLWLLACLIIGVRCGLRAGDVLNLPFEPLRQDSTGQYTLVYINNKASRELAIPIVHSEVVTCIRQQQQAVRERFPGGCPWLFPKAQSNPDGRFRLPRATLRRGLREWIVACGVTDVAGQPAKVTFHQFRHTFATRLLEDGAPEHLIQRLLGHKSLRSTRGYSELSDRTKREEFFKYARINNRGEEIRLNPDSPIGDAEWMKEQLNRAKVTLPNGYCSLPLTQVCEARNACIDCDAYFVTTKEFLPVHQEQRRRTLTLLQAAEAQGSARMAEKNRQLLANLDRIIGRLEEGPAADAP
jgi:integrase